MLTSGELWKEYRITWESFSRNFDKLQELVEAGDKEGAAAAFLEVERSRSIHTAVRDRLSATLMDGIGPKDPVQIPVEDRIRRTARLLWEFSGKTENSAESDWHRAEQLVRSLGGQSKTASAGA